jgi:hypothetical protein
MDIDLIARLRNIDEFFNSFIEGDQFKRYQGRSLVFFSLGNSDLDSRYYISNFLVDKGVDVRCLNDENESVLHVLLGQTKHDLDRTIELCSKFLSLGVNINALDNKKRVAFQSILNMKYTDEQLRPLYDLWFSQPYLELKVPNAWGLTPIDLAQKVPYRKEVLERMQKYVEKF